MTCPYAIYVTTHRPAICDKLSASRYLQNCMIKQTKNATKNWNLYKSCVSLIYSGTLWKLRALFAFILYMTSGSISSSQIVKFHLLSPRYIFTNKWQWYIKSLLCLYLQSSYAILLKILSFYFVFTITPNLDKFNFVKNY